MGIDFRADEEFPADDTGYGFDNIGDVLTTSPLLLEKYMQAAEIITARAIPLTDLVIPRREVDKDDFRGEGDRQKNRSEIVMPVYDGADVRAEIKITQPGTYRIALNASIVGSFAYDPGKARATWFIEDQPVWEQEIKWQAEKKMEHVVERKWAAGTYALRMKVIPSQDRSQRPGEIPGDGQPWVDLRFRGAIIEGPLEPEHATRPDNYARFFPASGIPADPSARQSSQWTSSGALPLWPSAALWMNAAWPASPPSPGRPWRLRTALSKKASPAPSPRCWPPPASSSAWKIPFPRTTPRPILLWMNMPSPPGFPISSGPPCRTRN